MTTEEIQEELAKRDREINKVKSHNTRMAKALDKAGVDVPQTNWETELEDEKEEEGEE